ncbi:MAG TPA: polysaccharide biosynthesis tyrosine autokinase, partial [Actinomycetota bacterium]|nr:polysaccharide biosynthesis tyrosine autokinase [Actinomycetota bacterium]
VLVTPATSAVGPEVGIPERSNLGTEKELVSSEPVVRLVEEELGAESDEDLTDDLTVDVVTDTEIVVIMYDHPDPLVAQRRAGAFANAYLEFRSQQIEEDIHAATAGARQELQRLERRLTRVTGEIAQLEAAADPAQVAELSALQTERALLSQEIANLRATLPNVEDSSLRVGQVVEPATLPVTPVSPDHLRNVLLALFVGLALGVGVAFLRERLDDRLRGRVDMEQRVGAPVLAVVPRVPSWRRTKDARLVTVREPKSGASEAYRTLRTGLQYLASQEDVKVVLITSPHQEEGKTTTAANLGVVLANAGKRTVVVGADLRKPRLHQFFAKGSGAGLSMILSGHSREQNPLMDTGIRDLRLLSSGPVPARPAELLGSEMMGKFLDWLRDQADFVVIDTAPILVVSDALTLAPLADAVLLVADAGRTTRGAVTHAREQLAQVNARVVGAVLNNFDPSRAKASPYYYRYQYVYRYAGEPAGRRRDHS